MIALLAFQPRLIPVHSNTVQADSSSRFRFIPSESYDVHAGVKSK